MWKNAYVGVYQLLNWKMHGETLKIVPTFFPKRGSKSFTRRFWNSVKFSYWQKQSNPWLTISTITANTCLLLRHKVAKDRSIRSVDHRSIEICSATIPCASGCTLVDVFVKITNNWKQSLHYSIQNIPDTVQLCTQLEVRRLQKSVDWPALLLRQRSCRMERVMFNCIARVSCPLHLCKEIQNDSIFLWAQCLKTSLMFFVNFNAHIWQNYL